MGKVLVGILAVFLLLGAFASPINTGIKGWRSNDTSEPFIVTTAVSVTSANVTLSYDLYQATLAEVQSITSTDGTDVPTWTAYVEATKKLTVGGLNDDASRTLTVHYYAETESDVMRVLGPFLSILIFGGLLFGVIMGIFGKRR